MQEKFSRKKLKNGITVIHESRDLPLVSLSISNKFGAAYETSEIKGIAHVIEHLVFTGTKTRDNEEITREIEKKGGILNAFTSHDVTSFWFKLPSEHIFSGLEILTDILKNPTFELEKFEKEKHVVLEEIKMYHDSPARHAFEQIEKNLYEKPFGELVIGSEKTVSSLQRDFVMEYFKKVYNPENFIVTIVGSCDFEKVCDFLENNFENSSNPLIKIQEIKTKNDQTEEFRSDIDQAHFVFAFHAPLSNSEEFPALEVLDGYLANGMSSKLFIEIREKRGLAYAVKSDINSEKNYSYYSIYVGTTAKALPEVKSLILKEFENVENMTEKDLQEAKERIIGLKKISSEESASVMNELLFSEISGKAEDYYEYENKIKKVTLDQVKALAKIKDYSTVSILPKPKE